MTCISRDSIGPPDELLDTSNLSLSLDNQGMATLQLVKLTKDDSPITDFSYSFNFNGGKFSGFLLSDTPRRMEGSNYIEHFLVYRGMVCEGSSSGPAVG